jgi:hypothetical protein
VEASTGLPGSDMREAYFPLVLSHFLLALCWDSFGVLPRAVTDFLPSDILVLECPPKLKILSTKKLSLLVLELIAESLPSLTGLCRIYSPPLSCSVGTTQTPFSFAPHKRGYGS